MDDWHETVYKEAVTDDASNDWKRTRWLCISRDHRKCRRCGAKKHLTVHHIIPREEGGGNNLENLITLCPKCHDLVEIEGYRTISEICCNDDIKQPVSDIEFPDDTDLLLDWHSWVYGGSKRPVQDYSPYIAGPVCASDLSDVPDSVLMQGAYDQLQLMKATPWRAWKYPKIRLRCIFFKLLRSLRSRDDFWRMWDKLIGLKPMDPSIS